MLVAFVGAMFAACSKDLDSDPVNPAGPNEGPEGPTTTVTFSLAPSDMSAPSAAVQLASAPVAEDADEAISFGLQPATRATVPASDAEKTLVSVCILQFDGETDAAKLTLNKYFTKADGDITDKNTLSVPLNEYEKTTVYAIANIAKTAADKFTSDMTLADFKKAKIGMSVIESDTEKLKKTGLPMMGSVTSADFTDAAATVTLSFLVAKIVMTPTVSMQTGLGSFSISSAELRLVADSVAVEQPETISASVMDLGDDSYDKQTGSGPFTWYVPENMGGEVAGLKASQKSWWTAPNNATQILIFGTYETKVTPKKTYNLLYTLYPGANATINFDIKRNTVYKINPVIKGINPKDLRLTAISSEGEEIVDLSKSETANCYMAATPLGLYRFNATVKGNNAITAAASISGQNPPAINASQTPLNPQAVKVLWETGSTTKGEVVRAVKLSSGCVYFTTAGNLESAAPVVEANALIGVTEGKNQSVVEEGSGANVAWSWHIWSTSYDPSVTGGTHTHKTRPISGNASYNNVPQRPVAVMTRNLGAANNTQGNVGSFGLLYQWGRKDPFVGASSSAANTTTFATSTRSTWPTATGSGDVTNVINMAVKSPVTFLLQRNTTQYDWLGDTYANQRDNLWGNPNKTTKTPNTEQGAKSIYDPCPPGWRVAPQDTWTNFTKTGLNTSTASDFNVSSGGFNIGWNFYYEGTATGYTVYYPAAGYRASTTGALDAVGTEGVVWSSSSFAAGYRNAGNLWFRSGYVSPLLHSHRAYAFSVRCVQN